MRTGACTVQQALTAEAASALKHSLNLATRRGHAQVTPLHVAATLLSSSSFFSNLLRRACLKSQPHHPASHHLQCRALELCFNVALNRLPTTPPSSGSLLHPPPSLSNALIAALKRAQAQQRRGCIELQQQQPPLQDHHQQQQQPLLAIKVELEQLILSILDDPSVSRVMREAGFSSICVKSNLEEETVLCHSSQFLLEAHKNSIFQGSSFRQNHFLKSSSEQSQSPDAHSSLKEDLKVVLEIMLRKQDRRTNAVLVGDSVSMTEGLVTELVGRAERGEVPGELKSAQFINLHLSDVHLRLMNKSDVDMKVSDLRRKIGSLASSGGGVIIYAGDLRWAVDDEASVDTGFKPVEHMVSEMGSLLSEFRCGIGNGGVAESSNKVWLLATSTFQTYMKCQEMRQPSLESQWALQAVVVPSDGLALSLQASSGLDSRVTNKSLYPVRMFEPKILNMKEDATFECCIDCAANFEREASSLKPQTTETSNSAVTLPCWRQSNTRPKQQIEDAEKELRRKWSRLCQNLHQGRQSLRSVCSSMFDQDPAPRDSISLSQTWWSRRGQANQMKNVTEPHSISFSKIKSELMAKWQEKGEQTKQWLPELSLCSIKLPARDEAGTTPALRSAQYTDSVTSKDHTSHSAADMREVRRRLQENIPWQSEAIPSIIEALHDIRTTKNETWILIHGSDHVAKRRMALVMAESLCGSTDKLIRTNLKTCAETFRETFAAGGAKCVFLIEGISQVHINSIKSLMNDQKDVSLADAIFILAISKSSNSEEANDGANNRVIKIRLQVEDSSSSDLKRKQEEEQQSSPKKRRTGGGVLDLNLTAEDDAVLSDLTHESDCSHLLLPQELLESTVQLTLEAGDERSRLLNENIVSKLRGSFDEASKSAGAGEDRSLFVDKATVEELSEASGFLLESVFERWAREVLLQGFSLTVKNGGSVRLVAEGKEGSVGDLGFMGSVLPNRIHF